MSRRPPRNLTRYWRASRLPGLSLLQADLADQEFPPHMHEALVIAVTEVGGAAVRIGGASETARPASVLVCNPGEPHSGEMGRSRRWIYRGLYFEHGALAHLQETLGTNSQPYFKAAACADMELAGALLAAHRLSEDPSSDAFQSDEAMTHAMGMLYGRHGGAKPQSPPKSQDRVLIDRAVGILNERFAEPLQLGEIAAELGLTPFQLIGMFKRQLGLPPYALLTQIRLNRVCSMLKRGAPIADAAIAAGFYDQAALTKHFRARFAVTPGQFSAAL